MAMTEAQRFEMHSSLRKLMGEEVANTMMEHLPPLGWGDVARRSDIDRVEIDVNRVEVSLSSEITRVESALTASIARVEKRIDHLVAGLWAMGSLMATGFIGIFTLIATKL